MTHVSYTIVGFGVSPPPDISDIVTALEARYGVGMVAVMRVEFTPPIVSIPKPLALPVGALGIDVSRHNGIVDWDGMKAAGVKFAAIRSTLGATGLDEQFRRNWAEASRVGILKTNYHYFINNTSGLPQVENMLNVLGGNFGDIEIVLDVERATNQVITDRAANTREIAIWLTECENRTGIRPIIYTNKSAWDACTNVPAWSSLYKLWHAQYTSALVPKINLPWTSCAIWQYSASGNLAGKSPLDLNRWGPYP